MTGRACRPYRPLIPSSLDRQSVLPTPTAVLSALVHLAMEDTVWPTGASQWGEIVLLGLLPVGATFHVWNHGVRHATSSFRAPPATPLATLVLILGGEADVSAAILGAADLITAGATLAALPLFRRLVGREEPAAPIV